jgi:Putative lumazine-binding
MTQRSGHCYLLTPEFKGTHMHTNDLDHPARRPLDAYIKGHQTGDGEVMRSAFFPTAHIEGVRDGAFSSWTMQEYIARFDGTPAADEATRIRTIDLLDVHGSVAMARMTLLHGATKFTDMFVLLEQAGEWRIANKAYHMEPLVK